MINENLFFPELFQTNCDIQNKRDSLEIVEKFNSKLYSFQKIKDIPKDFSGKCRVLFAGHWFNLLIYTKNKAKVIFSFTSGDRSKSKDGTLFTRWKYNTYFEDSFVCIDSPMSSLYEGLSSDTPSWYFGDKTLDLCEILSNFIKDFCNQRQISEITLLGSSAGGYAAALVGSHIPNSFVIAISPQFIISNWYESSKFESETGIKLSDFARNDIRQNIINSRSTRYLFIFNQRAKRDITKQLTPLIKQINPQTQLCYGLNSFENILIWLHNTDGISYHSSGIEKLEVYIAYWILHSKISKHIPSYQGIMQLINEYINQKAILSKKNIEINNMKTNSPSLIRVQQNILKDNYEAKKFQDIIKASQTDEEIEKLFYYGMSQYRLKNYDLALKYFEILGKIDISEKRYKPSLIGYCLYRQGKIRESLKWFYEALKKEPKIDSILPYYLAANYADSNKIDTQELIRLTDNQQNKLLLQTLDLLYDMKNINNVCLDEFFSFVYSLKTRELGSGSDICYFLIHPKISGHGLFENRKFDCDVIFLEQKKYYVYFMLMTDLMIKKVDTIIKKHHYKQFVLLGTCASAFISLVLGAKLAALNPDVHFVIHAFSPRINVNDNPLLKNVNHYKSLQGWRSFRSVNNSVTKYGNVCNQLNRDLKNLSIFVYYGDSDDVDRAEANKLIDMNLPYVHDHKIPGFPFHQSFFLFRYDDDNFVKNIDKMYPTLGNDSSKYSVSVEELLKIKHLYAFDLQKIIPLMHSRNS